jgi:hypothetical protein
MGGAPIDLLYRLTQRDQAFPHWGPAQGRLIGLVGGANIITTEADFDAVHLAPRGTILFLTAVLIIGTPRDTTTVREVFTEVVSRSTGLVVVLLNHQHNVAPVANQKMGWQTTVDYALDTDRFFLRGIGNFVGGGAGHEIDLNWTGYIVPRGEIGFG